MAKDRSATAASKYCDTPKAPEGTPSRVVCAPEAAAFWTEMVLLHADSCDQNIFCWEQKWRYGCEDQHVCVPSSHLENGLSFGSLLFLRMVRVEMVLDENVMYALHRWWYFGGNIEPANVPLKPYPRMRGASLLIEGVPRAPIPSYAVAHMAAMGC